MEHRRNVSWALAHSGMGWIEYFELLLFSNCICKLIQSQRFLSWWVNPGVNSPVLTIVYFPNYRTRWWPWWILGTEGIHASAVCVKYMLWHTVWHLFCAGRDLFLWLRITSLPWGIRVTLVCAPISLLVRIFGDTIILLTSQLPVLVNLHSSWFLQYLWCILLFSLVVLLIHQPPDKKSSTTNT